MKIVITVSTDSDYYESEAMTIDGKDSVSVHPLCECPEDAIIGRDLISCQEIAELMKKAYTAGKNGEKFEVEVIESNPDEEN